MTPNFSADHVGIGRNDVEVPASQNALDHVIGDAIRSLSAYLPDNLRNDQSSTAACFAPVRNAIAAAMPSAFRAMPGHPGGALGQQQIFLSGHGPCDEFRFEAISPHCAGAVRTRRDDSGF